MSTQTIQMLAGWTLWSFSFWLFAKSAALCTTAAPNKRKLIRKMLRIHGSALAGTMVYLINETLPLIR